MPLPNLERIEQEKGTKGTEQSVYTWKEIGPVTNIPDIHLDYVADEERLSQLFNTLDKGNDGFIRLEELQDYMKEHHPHLHTDDAAADIIAAGDIHKDGKLDYQEFMLYMIDHERVLWKSFKELDKDGNGSIGMDDLEQHCTTHGITLDKEAYLKRIDKDGNLQIEWEEWISFHQFSPSNFFSNNIIGQVTVYGMPGETALMLQEGKPGPREGSLMANFVCGGFAGAFSRTMTAPLDRIKVMLQVQGSQTILGKASTERLNMWGVTKQIIAEGGWRSLWKGNKINCGKIVPENASRLLLFNFMLDSDFLKGQDSMKVKFACGAATGAVVQTLMFPIELVKTRVMLQPSDMKLGFWKTWCSLGDSYPSCIRGSFRGLGPAIIGIIPFSGIELSSVTVLNRWWADRQHKKYIGSIAGGIIGTSCTVTASFMTYPMKLLTTRQQAHKSTEPIGNIQLFKQIYRKDGIAGYWRGFIPNAIKVVPSSFCSWTAYTVGLNLWSKHLTKSSSYN